MFSVFSISYPFGNHRGSGGVAIVVAIVVAGVVSYQNCGCGVWTIGGVFPTQYPCGFLQQRVNSPFHKDSGAAKFINYQINKYMLQIFRFFICLAYCLDHWVKIFVLTWLSCMVATIWALIINHIYIWCVSFVIRHVSVFSQGKTNKQHTRPSLCLKLCLIWTDRNKIYSPCLFL